MSTVPKQTSSRAARRAFVVTTFAHVLAPAALSVALPDVASAQAPAAPTATAGGNAGANVVAPARPTATSGGAAPQAPAAGLGVGTGYSGPAPGFSALSGIGARMGGGLVAAVTNNIRAGRPTVEGALPPEVARRYVLRNLMRFRRCFEIAYGAAPTAVTAATLQFTINAQGSVTGASAYVGTPRPGVRPTPLQTCLNTAITAIAFPTPDSGIVRVEYPLFFGPPGFVVPSPSASSGAPSSPPAAPAWVSGAPTR